MALASLLGGFILRLQKFPVERNFSKSKQTELVHRSRFYRAAFVAVDSNRTTVSSGLA